MPLYIKAILTACVLWSGIYTASYAVFEMKRKNIKGAVFSIIAITAMLLAFISAIFFKA